MIGSVRRRSSASGAATGPGPIARDALVNVVDRLARSLATAAGTALGIAMLVAVVGLGQTARSQIDRRFDALAATQVEARPAASSVGDVFPPEVDDRGTRIDGAEAAGTVWEVLTEPAPEVASGSGAVGGIGSRTVPVFAASAGIFGAAEATGIEGRVFDGWHDDQAAAVAVLGRSAANLLGIGDVSGQRAVFVDGEAYLLLGIVDAFPRFSALDVGMILPDETARSRFGPPTPASDARLLVRTRVGAAEVVAAQLAVAVRPDDPGAVAVVPPVTPRRLAAEVGGDLRFAFLGLGLLAVAMGGLGIANACTVAVLERRGEIGLRIALGARRRQIGTQFLVEALAIGALGGALAAGLGSLAVVGMAAARQWTPVLSPQLLAAAPVAGALVGAVAGTVPALRAARLDPVAALRALP